MKLGKKATAFCAVVAGAAIFTTSALADVVIGSGYYSLKDAVKQTSKTLTKDMDNFTLDAVVSVRADGAEIVNASGTVKVDAVGKKMESVGSVTSAKEGTEESYTYNADDKSIYRTNENKYVVYERIPEDGRNFMPEDIFEEEIAEDAEKLMDAFVGNLKDLVQVEEKDGKKMYIGNVSDAQIPTVANAALSFMLKYSIFDDRYNHEMGLPALETDIYVKEVSGKAVENESGILENAVIMGTLVGKDENGVEHTVSGECALTLRDIHQTVVTEPNLDGKDVEYVAATARDEKRGELGQRYVGKYKIDIIDTQEDQFVKIGERVFEITSIDGKNFTATYAEQYKDGYAPEVVRNYSISGYYSDKQYEYVMDYTDENGNQAHGAMMPNNGDVRVNFGVEFAEESSGYSISSDFDFRSNTFIRVFD
ncbi:MAG: hypothetical protein HFI90_11820 [Clostridia bacterium]|nr:hypothetical protein [Clostridia bacterium]